MALEFLIEVLYDDDGNTLYAIQKTDGKRTESICHGIKYEATAVWLLDACRWKASIDQGFLSLPVPAGLSLKKRVARKKPLRKRDET